MDAATAAFLQETLRPQNPVIPKLYDGNDYLNQGLSLTDRLNAQAAARQSLALNQAKVDALPLDKKYNVALQTAQITRLNAQAEADRANAALRLHRATPTSFNAVELGDYESSTANPSDALPSGDGTTSSGLFQSFTPDLTEDPSLGAFKPAPALDLSTGQDQGGNDETAAATSLSSANLPTVPSVSSVASSAPASGLRTVTNFGLNLDGSVDAQDNGKTAFGDNSRDPNARIASIPFSEARERDLAAGGPGTLAHFKTLPAGLRTVSISNPSNGRSTTAEIREFGPSENARSGATLDVTPAISKDLGGTGKDQLAVSYPSDGALKTPSLNDEPSLDSIVNGPLVAVNGADDPATAKVYNSSVPVRVPANPQDEINLRAHFTKRVNELKGSDQYLSGDPKYRAYIDKRVRDFGADVDKAIQTYHYQAGQSAKAAAVATRSNATSSAASSPLAATDPGTGLPVLPGFVPGHIKVANGKVNYDQLSPNDVDDEKEQSRQAARDRLAKEIALETHGGTPYDLLEDRGNYQDNPVGGSGKVTPGVHYFMQAMDDPTKMGARVLVEQPMSEQKYQQRRAQMAALGIGDPPAGSSTPATPGLQPVSTPGESAASILAANAAPNPMGLRPIKLALGRSAAVPDMSAISRPAIPVVPAATPAATTSAVQAQSGSSKLDAAAASVTPVTDAEKAAASLVAQDRARQAAATTTAVDDKEAATHEANDKKMLAYHMNQRLTPIDNRIRDLNSQLEMEQAAAANGFPAAGGGQEFAARKIQQLRQQRAAVLDKGNYKPLPGGGFQYVDPYDQNLLPTAFNPIPTSAGNVTVSRSQ